MAPVVEAYQAMRERLVSRSLWTFAAEIGDVRRFDTPRQLMSFLGLVPAERSTGDTIRRNGLTLAGNQRARRAFIEAAWTYHAIPRESARTLRARLEALPKPARDIAWKAQIRLVRPLPSAQAPQVRSCSLVVVAASAREMAAFLWAIGRGGRSSVSQDVQFMFFFRCAEPGVEHERWGTPVASYVAGLPPDARPSSRPRKAPRRRHGRR